MAINLKLGEVLVEEGYITEQQLAQALSYQKDSEKRIMLGDALIELGFITEQNRMKALSKRLHIKIMTEEQLKSGIEAITLVPKEKALEESLLPLAIDKDILFVATDNPLNYYGFSDLETATGKKIVPVLASKEDLRVAIEKNYANKNMYTAIDDANREYTQTSDGEELSESFQQMMERVDSSPVVKLVNTIIMQAVNMRASDIHVEPRQKNVNIRYRIDGDLVEAMVLNTNVLIPLTTRLKIMGQLDIAEKRIPQDGRFAQSVGGRNVNFRMSTLPSVFGEKVVLRILGESSINIVHASELGMTEKNFRRFERLIRNPNGVILVTGPTGSGKTTTIYSVLNELALPEVNIVTVEDPVEKYINNVTQVHINPKAGLTFAAGLRSIMRQDPDIIMVGEVRDKETAEIAAQAAITGHLVLTTVHTNDAASAFMRLTDIGVEPYIVASAVIGVVSQRLIKLICEDCKTEYEPDEAELLHWDQKRRRPPVFYKGCGCEACNHTGYNGRTAVHEIIIVNDKIRQMIVEHRSSQEIKEAALQGEFTDLKSNMMDLIEAGRTTMTEMIRAVNFLED